MLDEYIAELAARALVAQSRRPVHTSAAPAERTKRSKAAVEAVDARDTLRMVELAQEHALAKQGAVA